MPIGIPPRVQRGQHYESVIYQLRVQRDGADSGEDKEWYNPQGLRTVLGYPLPTWQRGFVWTHQQKVKFIESVWYGYDLGTYTYQKPDTKDGVVDPNSFLLIDGQQRLKAIEDYWNDEFPVFGLYWSEVPKAEQRRFMQTKFPSYEIDLGSDEELREAYNRMNFGGTPHTEDQRA